MVRLTRIYTRSGDQGETSLGDGSRIAKDSLRIQALGGVDESNASLGVARLHTNLMPDIDSILARIQNDLFDLGADLCLPLTPENVSALRISQSQVDYLEAEIDRLNSVLPSLNSFVLPGGTPAAAFLHLTRTIVRRAERDVVALLAHEKVNDVVVRYLNRLSDYLFVLSRWLNRQAEGDTLWVPGGK